VWVAVKHLVLTCNNAPISLDEEKYVIDSTVIDTLRRRMGAPSAYVIDYMSLEEILPGHFCQEGVATPELWRMAVGGPVRTEREVAKDDRPDDRYGPFNPGVQAIVVARDRYGREYVRTPLHII
jgi:hypothetical protein